MRQRSGQISLIPVSQNLRNLQVQQTRLRSSTSAIAFYSLYLVNIKTRSVQSFGFDVSPQSFQLTEDAAIDYQPLGGGNYFIDERGSYNKILTMSGTFGYRPANRISTPGPLRANQTVQDVAGALSDFVGNGGFRQGVPETELTGFDRYRALKNLIRQYWILKENSSTASQTLMVYADWKFGEVFVVSPMRCTRSRTVPQNRFTVQYQLQLRLLSPLAVKAPYDYFMSVDSPEGLLWLRQKTLAAAQLVRVSTQALQRTISAAIDFGFDLVDGILRPLQEVANFVIEAEQGVRRIVEDPLGILKTVYQRCLTTAEQLYNATINSPLGSDVYWQELGNQYLHLATQTAALFTGASKIYKRGDVNDAAAQIGKRYTDRSFFDFSGREQSAEARRRQAYARNVPIVGGNGFDLGQRSIPSGVEEHPIPPRSSLRTIAQQRLGAASRWKEIQVLNRLKPPYISPNGDGVRVLRPGLDKIKIPAPIATETPSSVVAQAGDVSEARMLGRDLRIDLTTMDLQVDENGDLATIEGRDNLRQAIHIKVKTRPGEMKLHPWFGFAGEAGMIPDPDNLSALNLSARTTLLSDPRIEGIDFMSLTLEQGDVLKLYSKLRLIGGDIRENLFLQSTLRS